MDKFMTDLLATLGRIASALEKSNELRSSLIETPAGGKPAPSTKAAAVEDGDKPAAKKAATKKAPAKKAPAKKAPPAEDDYEDLAVFKTACVALIKESGVADHIKKLKAFITSEGYASIEEVEVEDRGDFVDALKEKIEELLADAAKEDDEDEDF